MRHTGNPLRGTALAFVASGFVACGARDEPHAFVFGTPLDGGFLTQCFGDLDCGLPDLCAPVHCVAGACVAGPKVSCDDGDPCTTDQCLPATGACKSSPLTFDEDGDGHRAPLPGFAPGAPGACGDDCNDASPLAYPGAVEKCDGVDNDCNGIVDDGALYTPVSAAPLLLSPGAVRASPGGMAFGTTTATFGVLYDALIGTQTTTTFTAFDSAGNVPVPSFAVTHVNTDSYSGPLVWTGSAYGAAWEDRRDGNFEIYFNRLDANGKKLGPDVRVSNAEGFSLRPDLLWDGTEFVVVWHDERDHPDVKGRIYGQRISESGALVGDNVALTPDGPDADDVSIAESDASLAILYNSRTGTDRQLLFRTLPPDLGAPGEAVVVGASGAASSDIVWSRDRYVVVWDTRAVVPGPTIQGATLSAGGTILLSERPVTATAPFARSQSIVPLGDRVLFAWAEERSGSYDIYTKMLTTDLLDYSAPVQVTTGSSDALGPGLSLGGLGTGAMVYMDDRTGEFEVYATRLACRTVTAPGP